jgi:two-component system sensor histidine kinase YesM
MSYSILKNFHAVVFFNDEGDFFSSNFTEHPSTSHRGAGWTAIPWIGEARAAKGRSIIACPYGDPWSTGSPKRVFSIVRLMPGFKADESGFLEVQKTCDVLESILSVPEKDNIRIVIFRPDGKLFFQNRELSSDVIGAYRQRLTRPPSRPRFEYNPLLRDEEMLFVEESAYSGLAIVMAVSSKAMLRPIGLIRWASLAFAFSIIAVSLLFNWIASCRLTRNLRLIQERIENTELADMPPIVPHGSRRFDEFEMLDDAFQELAVRLDKAMKDELRSRTAWIQARLESLQSQIDPHFMFNILNLIAGKGIERGDPEIGRICDAIASMLRYSTSTAEHSASLAEEFDHVRAYLFLMKQRFEEDLSFTAEADERILSARLPKIVLQQIVENSFAHGFRRMKRGMRVSVRGIARDDRWLVEIGDNGEGFAPETIESLRTRLSELRGALREGCDGTPMEIGGMGLMNTYLRLYLFYGGDVSWSVGNSEAGGARVVIGGPLRWGEEGIAPHV